MYNEKFAIFYHYFHTIRNVRKDNARPNALKINRSGSSDVLTNLKVLLLLLFKLIQPSMIVLVYNLCNIYI